MKAKRPIKLGHRVSTVTNSFVQCLLPDVAPSAEETRQALAVLGQEPDRTYCVYCGVPAADADHLRPLVRHRRPTGFLNDYRNRVPACGTCNTSKGGQDWRTWMRGPAAQGLRARGFSDKQIEARVSVLERFEAWASATPVDFERIVGAERWSAYWNRLDQIEEMMMDAQAEGTLLRAVISVAMVADRG